MFYSLEEIPDSCADEVACLKAILISKFGSTTFVCPSCNVLASFHAMTKRRAYACQECGHHVYPCAGTIFHGSRTPLTNWFFAMYLITTRRCKSAADLERQLGCTYKTALRMAKRLRKLIAESECGQSSRDVPRILLPGFDEKQ
jgi:transposase